MSRKKIILTAVILTLILIIGGILAYFTDVETIENKFTMGNVSILVEEPSWPDGGVTNIVPNQEIPKDPQITNKGSTDIYAFIKVEVPYENVVVGDATSAADTELFTYTLESGWKEVGTSTKDTQDKTITHIYAYVNDANELKALAKDEITTNPVFRTVTLVDIKETNDKNSIIQGKDLQVTVSGYGIQTTDLGTDSKAPADIWPLVVSAN